MCRYEERREARVGMKKWGALKKAGKIKTTAGMLL